MYHPEDNIGPYKLVRTLGRGAFGEVWLAERSTSMLTTRVAIKLPHEAHNDLDAIRDEAQIWLRASGHPNIVPVLDAEVYDGQVAIASEYVAGGSLEDLLDRSGANSLSPGDSIAMLLGILAGLEHLHGKGLIHRDLKPGNVLLQSGIPRLTDFGLARVLKSSRDSTNMAGTPGYMPPEAFVGEYCVASDVWAAGILLHVLLAGALPFPQTDFYSLLVQITSSQPVTLSDSIPESLAPILTRALAKPLSERFESAAEMAIAIRAATLQPASLKRALDVRPPTNLPIDTSSFVGRVRELEEIRALLSRSRLLTITGIGGCGKSRLALKVAAELSADWPDGVWLASLATLSDPCLVPQAIAGVLSISEQPGRSIEDTLVEQLRSKSLLLVLDGCEHLLDACASIADVILKKCENVKILATSREALGIGGEQTYRAPSLSLPAESRRMVASALQNFEATRLFLDRATAALPEFTVSDQSARTVASICRRLDGIPLAIELAAARLRSLDVEEIDKRLDNRFRLLTGGNRTALPRQQTLQAMIDWSFDLLSEKEKQLFVQLAVFAGGWSLHVAETVCAGEKIDEFEVYDLLSTLVAKSLVTWQALPGGHARFSLMETIREYGLDRLRREQSLETISERHALFFAGLAHTEGSQLRATGDRAFSALTIESANLRAALDWLWRSGRVVEAAGMSVDLSEFWTRQAWLREGFSNLETAVRHLDRLLDDGSRAVVLKAAGLFAYFLNDISAAERLTGQSIEFAVQAGAKPIQADALNNLGLVLQAQLRLDAACRVYEQSLEIYRSLNEDIKLADGLMNLGFVESALGNLDGARGRFDEARTIYERHADLRGVAGWLCNQSDLALRQSQWTEAESFAAQSLERFRQIDDRIGIAIALANLAESSARQGKHETVETSVKEACSICADADYRNLIATLLLTLARSQIDRCLWIESADSLATAHKLRGLLGVPYSDEELAEITKLEENLRLQVGEGVLAAARVQLAAITMDDLIARASAR